MTPDAQSENCIVQVLHSNSIRDIRSTLLEAIYFLRGQGNPLLQAVCVLLGSKVSTKRLATELALFKAVVEPGLAQRIHLASVQKGHELELPALSQDVAQWVRDSVLQQAVKEPPRGISQRSVFAHLVRSWLSQGSPQTVKAIQQATLLSYPTVAKVLDDLDAQGALLRTSDRRVGLNKFPWSEWKRWAISGANKQVTLRFVDPTGLPVSPDRMVRRLQAEAYPHVAVSGILGAKHYFPELDIRGDVRLDLVALGSVEAFKTAVVKELDPALELTDQTNVKAALVVHFPEPRRDDYFERGGETNWADPIDCLSDLYELRLDAQAEEMIHELIHRREGNCGGAMGGKATPTAEWT